MKQKLFSLWFIAAILLNLGAIHPVAGGLSVTNRPFPGISYYSETRSAPPTRIYIAEIDLTHPQLRVRATPGGPDPDGPGEWQTTLMRPTQIAARDGLDLVVNGDFFRARSVKDADGLNAALRSEIWSAVIGPAVTGGKTWSTSADRKPCLIVHKNRKVTIELRARPTPDDWEVLAGNTMLVSNGVAIPHTTTTRHPRTAVGLTAAGRKLIILVVDGRKPDVAVGMSYDELAAELVRLGCREGFNLDGGGSSMMAVRDSATSELHILNEPTDGRERAVANTLGISVERTR